MESKDEFLASVVRQINEYVADVERMCADFRSTDASFDFRRFGLGLTLMIL